MQGHATSKLRTCPPPFAAEFSVTTKISLACLHFFVLNSPMLTSFHIRRRFVRFDITFLNYTAIKIHLRLF